MGRLQATRRSGARELLPGPVHHTLRAHPATLRDGRTAPPARFTLRSLSARRPLHLFCLISALHGATPRERRTAPTHTSHAAGTQDGGSWKEHPESEASAQEPASRPRPRRPRRLRRPGPHGVRLGRHRQRHAAAAARRPAPRRHQVRRRQGPAARLRLLRAEERDRRLGQGLHGRLQGRADQLQADGSGEGITAFTQGQVAFAGSDSALKPEEVTDVQEDLHRRPGHRPPDGRRPDRGRLQPAGCRQPRRWTPRPSPRSSTARSRTWNDPAIAKLNPGAKLPSTKIQAFHRSDDSGTTDNFTKYLDAAAPADWKYEPGKAWQAKGGQAASGSSGVAAAGQADRRRDRLLRALLRQRRSISTVDINTGAAAPVEATVENASKAIAAAKVVGTGKDLALELDYSHQGRGRLPDRPGDLRDRLRQGQQGRHAAATQVLPELHRRARRARSSSPTLGYAPIPAEIIAKVRETIAEPELTRAVRPASARPAGAAAAVRCTAARSRSPLRRPAVRRPENPMDTATERPTAPPTDRRRRRAPSRSAPARGATRPGDRIFLGLSRGSGILLLVIMAAIAVFLTYRAILAICQGRGQLPHHLRVERRRRPAGLRHRGPRSSAPSSARSSRWPSRSRSPSASRCSSRTTRRASWPRPSPTSSTCSPPCRRIVYGLWGALFLVPHLNGLYLWLDELLRLDRLFDWPRAAPPARCSPSASCSRS